MPVVSDVGWYPRELARFALPARSQEHWSRRFGPDEMEHHGKWIPSGMDGRRAFLYLLTQGARRRRDERRLGEGKSVRWLGRWLGVGTSGGKRSGIEGVRQQIRRIADFEAVVQLGPGGVNGNRVLKAMPSAAVVQHLQQGFDPLRLPDELGEQWAGTDTIPVDMEIVRQLGKDTLAFDLYVALTYRSFVRGGRPTNKLIELPLRWLKGQLGANFGDQCWSTFRQRVGAALEKVMRLYTGLNARMTATSILILPGSTTSVPTRPEKAIDRESPWPGDIPSASRGPPGLDSS